MRTRLAGIAVLAIVAAAFGLRRPHAAFTGTSHMTSLSVRFEKAQYAPMEPVTLRVHIANVSGGEVVLPHPQHADGVPYYRLVGPSFPEGKTFHGAPGAPARVVDGTPPPAQLSLPPGADWEGSVPLGGDAAPTQPGSYRLAATLDPSRPDLEIPENTMQIAAYAPASTDLGFGIAPSGIAEGDGALLQPAGDRRTLISFDYHEAHPDIREIPHPTPLHRLSLPQSATDVRVPRRNVPFFADLRRHILWREGRVVKSILNTGVQFAFTAPFDVAELVSPVLRAARGPVEVLALSADRRQLALVRFTDRESPTLGWTLDLETTAAAVTCALGSPAGGSPRFVAVVSESQQGGLSLGITRFGDGAPEPVAMRQLGAMRLVPNTVPSVFAGADGRLTVGLLVIRPDQSVALFETTVSGAEHKDVVHDAGAFTEAPLGGAVLYTPTPEGALSRRDAAILLRSGALIHISPGGTAAPSMVHGRVFGRVELVPGRQGPFILFIDPQSGPYLEAF